jgi:hypothetical protein
MESSPDRRVDAERMFVTARFIAASVYTACDKQANIRFVTLVEVFGNTIVCESSHRASVGHPRRVTGAALRRETSATPVAAVERGDEWFPHPLKLIAMTRCVSRIDRSWIVKNARDRASSSPTLFCRKGCATFCDGGINAPVPVRRTRL